MRIAMLDPSAFTIPYDTHLCRGLGRAGMEVDLFTRGSRRDDYFHWHCNELIEGCDALQGFCVHKYFYSCSEHSNILMKPRPIKGLCKFAEHLVNMSSLRRSLRRRTHDVVHFQWLVVPFVDRSYVRRIRQSLPVILTVHDTSAFHAPTSRFQLMGWCSALREFDKLIVHTDRSKQALLDLGMPQSVIAIVPHGVLHHGKSDAHLRDEHRDQSQLTILMFGAIKPYKGLDVLIKSLSLLPTDKRLQVRLIVAGKPSIPNQELHRLAVEYNVNSLIDWHLRFIPESEISNFFSRCDVVVFPYREIDASGVLMTALPYGKTIVASRIGIFEELLSDGTNALLVEPGDTLELALALGKLVDNRGLVQELGLQAAQLANGICSWDNIAKKTIEVYRDTMEQRDKRWHL